MEFIFRYFTCKKSNLTVLEFNKTTWILLNVVILRNLLELDVHWVVCLIHILYSEVSSDNFPGAKKGETHLASECKPFSRRLHAGGRSHDAHAVGFKCVILKIPIMRGAIHRTFAWMIYILVSKRVSIELKFHYLLPIDCFPLKAVVNRFRVISLRDQLGPACNL